MDDETALKTAERLYSRLAGQRSEVEEFDDYYDGIQPLEFASREWSEFHKDRYKGFADNWCAPVANAPAERLGITGIRLGGKGRKRALESLWDDWKVNDGDSLSSQGFLESIIARRSYTIVWGDDSGSETRPTFTWEHPGQVIVEYDPANPRKKRAAIKSYTDGDTEFLTLYTPDFLWKWSRPASGIRVSGGRTQTGLIVTGSGFSHKGGWVPEHPASDDVWPLPNPLGEVNVVEWQNRPLLGREPVSDIQGTKAMQDAVNLLWAFLFAAADHASMPARVVMGQEPPKMPILDANGVKVGEKAIDIKELQHGRLLWLTGQNAQIGQWDSAKLDVFTEVIESAIAHIAAQTRTPSHYLINSGNVPAAGYELAEAGLEKRCDEFQLSSNAPARDHFRLMAKAKGQDALAEDLRRADLTWKQTAVRSESQMADALLKKRQVGYPFEYLLEQAGESPTEIARIMEMVRRENDDPYLAQLMTKDATANAEPSIDSN